MSQPLTDAINALTTYANSITGESDTTLSDAVESLVDGYGGGGSMQSGSFVGTDTSNITVAVSSLCSHIYVYSAVAKSDDDISGSPYGRYAMLTYFADGNNGFFSINGADNSSLTANGGKIGRWGGNTAWTNRVEFSSTQIKIINMNLGGSGYKSVTDMTYNWIAW